jgi:hypothetical protein
MRYRVGVVVGACWLLLSGAVAWGVSCEGIPANSISRDECERNAKQESAPKPKPNESVSMGGGVVQKIITNVQEPDEFFGSPMRYYFQQVTIRPVTFQRRLGVLEATFGTPGGNEILIVNIPPRQQFTPGKWYTLTIVPMGVEGGKNSLGGPVMIPAAGFVSGHEE